MANPSLQPTRYGLRPPRAPLTQNVRHDVEIRSKVSELERLVNEAQGPEPN